MPNPERLFAGVKKGDQIFVDGEPATVESLGFSVFYAKGKCFYMTSGKQNGGTSRATKVKP